MKSRWRRSDTRRTSSGIEAAIRGEWETEAACGGLRNGAFAADERALAYAARWRPFRCAGSKKPTSVSISRRSPRSPESTRRPIGHRREPFSRQDVRTSCASAACGPIETSSRSTCRSVRHRSVLAPPQDCSKRQGWTGSSIFPHGGNQMNCTSSAASASRMRSVPRRVRRVRRLLRTTQEWTKAGSTPRSGPHRLRSAERAFTRSMRTSARAPTPARRCLWRLPLARLHRRGALPGLDRVFQPHEVLIQLRLGIRAESFATTCPSRRPAGS